MEFFDRIADCNSGGVGADRGSGNPRGDCDQSMQITRQSAIATDTKAPPKAKASRKKKDWRPWVKYIPSSGYLTPTQDIGTTIFATAGFLVLFGWWVWKNTH